MRELSPERAQFYRKIVELCQDEYQTVDAEIQKIVQEIRERIDDFERDKEAALMVYAGACKRLGIPNEFEQDQEEAI